MKTQFKIFFILTILVSLIYPLSVTFVSQLFWKEKAYGSIIYKKDQAIASQLIGQEYSTDKWFQGRPSTIKYNSLSSGASQYSPIKKDFVESVKFRKSLGLEDEMLFNSGSGLDPHISLQSALNQIDRIALARKFNQTLRDKLKETVYNQLEKRELGIFGNEKVNFVILNTLLEEGFNAQ